MDTLFLDFLRHFAAASLLASLERGVFADAQVSGEDMWPRLGTEAPDMTLSLLRFGDGGAVGPASSPGEGRLES